ncbi:MAG: metalloregulator ArsR/SmtB family transcription factor [Betaproteobacteria bacterium]|jgi:ArsR family transcriptional regulator
MAAALDKIFDALASGPRRQILAYLSEAELTTSELAQRFDMSAPAVSRHLSVLENAGLVTSQRRGQFVHYALNRDSLVNSLTGYAFELCPVGRPLKRESKAIAKGRARKPSLASMKD